MKYLLYSSLFLLLLSSCEDVIDVTPDDAPVLLVVDGWIDNRPEAQTIRLTRSQPYFNNAFASGVTGATVIVESSSGSQFVFEDQNDGNYVWTPAPGQTIGNVGETFLLGISVDGKNYGAVADLDPVPVIDSIVQEFRTDELVGPDGIYAKFFARDLPGLGNAYWIKTYKNGAFLNKPLELNIAFDAAFDPGAELDNVNFIEPIREAVNRIPDPNDFEDNADKAPWAPGDSILVEIHSINEFAFKFLDIAREQMTNGDNTIFALPLSNTTGNIVAADSNEKALGIFNVASVSSLGKKIE